MNYSDERFGVIERKWFGLTKKAGGDAASGFTFGTTDATSINQVTRFYPKGPIRMQKFGYLTLGTVSGGGTGMDVVPLRLRVDGSNESSTINIPTAAAPWSIGSTTTFTNEVVDAGSYIDIITGTPQTSDGTAANTATSSGTVAFFLDYTRAYDNQTKWDPVNT
jgi:hypothetical protein